MSSSRPQPETPAGTAADAERAPSRQPSAPEQRTAVPGLPGGAAQVGRAPSQPKKILLPPPQPGASSTQLEGCLAVAAPSEADAAVFPEQPRAVTRSGAPLPEVTVTPTGGGVVVEHRLGHSCCLKAEVSTQLEGRTVTVVERLTGTPCRCRCSSRVSTAVGLPPGSYTLKVQVEERAARRTAHQAPVEVKP